MRVKREESSMEPGAVPRGFHQMMKQVGGGGLAVGAGNAGDGEILPGMARQRGSQGGNRGAAVRHVQPHRRRGVVRGLGGFRQDGGGPGGERVIDETVAVDRRAADGGEDHAGSDFTGRRGDGMHLRIQRSCDRDS
jgi:hypothetical protein